MISIVAKFVVAEGKDEAFLALVGELVVKSNEEVGCISYGIHKDVAKANTYAILEQWKDQAAIDAHNTSEHFTRLIPQVVELAQVEVDAYTPVVS